MNSKLTGEWDSGECGHAWEPGSCWPGSPAWLSPGGSSSATACSPAHTCRSSSPAAGGSWWTPWTFSEHRSTAWATAAGSEGELLPSFPARAPLVRTRFIATDVWPLLNQISAFRHTCGVTARLPLLKHITATNGGFKATSRADLHQQRVNKRCVSPES